MKNHILLFSLLGLLTFAACENATESQPEASTETAMSETTEPEQVLRHVVLFKFKDSASEAAVDSVVTAFRDLQDKIEVIQDFEWGTNNSPEGLNDGFTHSFLLTFASEEDRDAYLPHPDHKAFGTLLSPHLDKVLVVDYWAKE